MCTSTAGITEAGMKGVAKGITKFTGRSGEPPRHRGRQHIFVNSAIPSGLKFASFSFLTRSLAARHGLCHRPILSVVDGFYHADNQRRKEKEKYWMQPKTDDGIKGNGKIFRKHFLTPNDCKSAWISACARWATLARKKDAIG